MIYPSIHLSFRRSTLVLREVALAILWQLAAKELRRSSEVVVEINGNTAGSMAMSTCIDQANVADRPVEPQHRKLCRWPRHAKTLKTGQNIRRK